jgi:hypothetical protein
METIETFLRDKILGMAWSNFPLLPLIKAAAVER